MADENEKQIINDSSSEESDDDIMGMTFFKKYTCIKKLGEGSFGKIYEADYNNKKYALKFEDKNKGQNLLESEASIMNYLRGPYIPEVVSFGYMGNYNILVMQLMGRSLDDLINERKKFSIKTVAMLGFQIINSLEFIHDKHILHRDIKPDNFVMGLEEKSANVFILDFGLAKKYRSSKTLVQYPMINKKKLTGTARYASINALRGYEQGRRDDLEAVGYVLMYFLRGELPWQGMPGKNKEERYKKILQKKIDTSPKELCIGFPDEFVEYISYTRGMEYEEKPDYERLRNYFLAILGKLNEKFDYIYDWTTTYEIKQREDRKISTQNEIKRRKSVSNLMKYENRNNISRETNKDEEEKKNENEINNKISLYKKVSSSKEYTNKNTIGSKKSRKKSGGDIRNMPSLQEETCCSSACVIF